MCGLFKGNCLGPQKFLLPTQSLLVFAARSYGHLIFLTLEPWAGRSGVRLGLLAPKISLPTFYSLHVDVGPAHSTSPPTPTSVNGCGFFQSVVVRLPFDSNSDGSEDGCSIAQL